MGAVLFSAIVREKADWHMTACCLGGQTMMRKMDRRKGVALGASGIIAALAIGGALYFGTSDFGAKASKAQPYGDMIATLQSHPGEVAAYVNGQPIPASKVEAFIVYRNSGQSLGGGMDNPDTPQQYFDMLIDDEVLYQSAIEAGDAPTDAAVQAFATQMKQNLEAAIQDGGVQADRVAAMLDQVKGTPYGLEEYDSSPEMLAGFREQLAISKLNGQIISTLPVADRQDQAKVQAALKDFLTQAKRKATIKIVMTFPN